MNEKLSFACDYAKGAHPDILQRMIQTNMMETAGYGMDEFSESARNRIRKACGCESAAVEFLTGGTQTNAVMIDALLRSYQGVIAAETGHISVHEAGAIEANGHKVLTIPHQYGKISAGDVERYLDNYYNDANHEHMVMPGMVYLSHPSEYGTLYSKAELQAFREVCDKFGICALLAKGRLLGIQFDELFRNDLYMQIGGPAIKAAADIKKALREKGYRLCFGSPTNQIFVVMENEALKILGEYKEC